MSRSAGRPTLRDVGARAHVSAMTASRVLSGSARVSEQTAARVLAAAAELGYRADWAAASLSGARQRTRTVALLVPWVDDPWAAALHRAVEAACEERETLVICTSTRGDVGHERHLVAALAARRVDGFVLSAPAGDPSYLLREVALGAAVVTVGRPPAWSGGGAVVVDEADAVVVALEHLHERGHRRVVLLHEPGEAGERHREAFVRSQGEADAYVLPVTGPGGRAGRAGRAGRPTIAARLVAWLAHPGAPGAVMASGPAAAAAVEAAVEAVLQSGLRGAAPGVVALLPWQDKHLAGATTAVTCHDPVAVGRSAAALVFDHLEGVGPRTVTCPPVVMHRDEPIHGDASGRGA